MEVEVSGANPNGGRIERANSEKDRVRVKKKSLEVVLEQCQRALEMFSNTGCVEDDDDSDADGGEESAEGSSGPCRDRETDELCDLLKSRVECPDFLKKLEHAQVSVPKIVAEEGSSWDMVSENDLWEGGSNELDQEDYVLVRQEDIVEGIACFMAAYLLSLKQTKGEKRFSSFTCNTPFICGWKRLQLHYMLKSKYWSEDLTPNQLQEALCKTFSLKKKKGKLRKAWDGSKVIYNVASWGATAIGIYQNPALLRAASAAFWTSCHVISKLF